VRRPCFSNQDAPTVRAPEIATMLVMLTVSHISAAMLSIFVATRQAVHGTAQQSEQ
jgi:hypothetical protein